MLKIYVPAVIAFLGIGVLTYLQGDYTERFGRHSSAELEQYLKRLDALPMTVGDWEGRDNDLSAEEQRQYKLAHAKGYVSRTYHNLRTDQTVQISLICGHSVHISEHTPDMCYRAQGYTMPEGSTAYTVDRANDKADFQQGLFTKDSEQGARVTERIFWGWRTAKSKWQGPGLHVSKFRFAGLPALYKLYIIDPAPDKHRSQADGPCVAFVKEVLPEFDKYLSGEMDEKIAQQAAEKAKSAEAAEKAKSAEQPPADPR